MSETDQHGKDYSPDSNLFNIYLNWLDDHSKNSLANRLAKLYPP